MKFAFVANNRLSRFVSMNKLSKALAIFRPIGDFTKFDFIDSDYKSISDSDFETLCNLHKAACKSLDSAYGVEK